MQYQTNYPYATASQQYGARSQQREEQRRRQQEYSQALAQQVAQREQQQRREREMDQQYSRHNGGVQQNPPQQTFRQSRQDAFEPNERGTLDGLGRNNRQNSHTRFVRGQPQLHHRLPGGQESMEAPQATGLPPRRVSYAGPNFQPADEPQGFQSGFGAPGHPNRYQQQQPAPRRSWQQQLLDPSFGGPGPNMQPGWAPPQYPQQNPIRGSQFWPGQGMAEQVAPQAPSDGFSSPQHPVQQHLQPGYPQAEPPEPQHMNTGGRRLRTDIHDSGRGNQDEAERLRRKQQQQHEMQLALERQIEEKRQQKLEAKRRQDEEDRREIERFEEDQRRQRAEQERVQEEKRRKAELEQQKAEQAAAAVAAANQQAKLQQQQKLQAQLQHPQHAPPLQQNQHQHPQQTPPFQQQQHQYFQQQPQLQQPEPFSKASSPGRMKNPFTNSRAHLFEDPPPQLSPQRGPKAQDNYYGHPNQNSPPIRGAPQGFQGFNQPFPQQRNFARQSMDPTELRRQYNDMREELGRQKQLVEQLREAQAQIQHQQHQLSPMRAENGNIPTLLDLENLRNELREELAYREQLHQREFASLKREQQQERRLEPQYREVKMSLELPVRVAPSHVENVPPPLPPSHEPRQQLQNIAMKQQQLSQVENGPLATEARMGESLMSLRGESTFVYFDNQVDDTEEISKQGLEDTLDEKSDSIKVKAPQIQRSLTQRSPTKLPAAKQAIVASTLQSPSTRKANDEDADTDSDDNALGFVVTGIPPSSSKSSQQLISSPSRAAASSHRYSRLPTVQSTSSFSKDFGRWRLESMGTNGDSDDDLDASLNGEQLEALFQRNVRRHEILLGFQNKVHAQTQGTNQQEDSGAPHAKMAWAELHQQLERNRRASILDQLRKVSTRSASSNDSNPGQRINPDDEAALVASSQWMPSSLLLPSEQATRGKNFC